MKAQPTFQTRAQVEQSAAAVAEKAAKKAESERRALARLADCVRDARALGLAGPWSVGAADKSAPEQPPSLTLALRDAEVGATLTAFIFGDR